MLKLEHRRGVPKKKTLAKGWRKEYLVRYVKSNSHKLALAAVSKSNYLKYQAEIVITYLRATFSCENQHFAFFLSHINSNWERKKAKCRFSQLKVARVNAG